MEDRPHDVPVRVRGVERRFRQRRALAGVDLDVRRGQIVGMVGANGSGKTTLLKLLAGFLRADRGTVRVFGLDPWVSRAEVMARARFVFAPPALFPLLTAREHVDRLSRLSGAVRGPRPGGDVERALDTVGLGSRADDRVVEFSFGMRQRLALAQALVPLPQMLFLDEPTDGLDPLAVLDLRRVLARLRDEFGLTLLLSSHLLVEIGALADRLLVLSEGRRVFEGAPHELTAGGERLVLQVDDAERAVGLFGERGVSARTDGDGRIELAPGSVDLDSARALLGTASIRLASFHVERPDLEQALIARLRRSRAAGGFPDEP